MWRHRNAYGTLRQAALVAVALACAGTGCERASPSDPDPPSGGQAYVLDYDVFAAQVDPVLTAHGCDNLNCHGGGIRGTFELSPQNDKDPAFDFAQACLQVYPPDPAESPLVMKPLAEECGGALHAGGAAFTSLDDPDYLTILTWIETGEYR